MVEILHAAVALSAVSGGSSDIGMAVVTVQQLRDVEFGFILIIWLMLDHHRIRGVDVGADEGGDQQGPQWHWEQDSKYQFAGVGLDAGHDHDVEDTGLQRNHYITANLGRGGCPRERVYFAICFHYYGCPFCCIF